MNPPLWYLVSQRKLSFREFDERFNDSLFQEKEILPILILSALYDHDPYVADVHVLQKRIEKPRLCDRTLRAVYLYWTLGRPFRADSILNGNGFAGTFHGVTISLPFCFDDEYLYNWLSVLLRSFFVLGPLHRSGESYRPGDMTQLTKGLKYIEEASANGFKISPKTMDKAYRLSIAHDTLKEVRSFFLGESFPSLIRPYRKSRRFFESAVDLYWPAILKGLEIGAPFDESEIEILHQAHEKLYHSGDLDFYFYYTEKIEQTFGKDHPVTLSLKTKSNPTPENEAGRIWNHLSRLDPYERKKFFLQRLMVTDRQLEEFVETIRKSSFEEAIRPYLLANKKRINDEISLAGGQIANNETLATQTSIYFYSPEDLIFYSNRQKIYIFLVEELEQFRDRQNPYDRQPLPEQLFEQAKKKEVADPIDELWQKILRRKVDFSSF